MLATAQHLQRRAGLGTRLAPHEQGMLITYVYPGSTADTLQLQAGDVIRQINGQEIVSVKDIVEATANVATGGALKVQVEREGKSMLLSGPLMAFPREQLPGVEIIYDEVPYKGGYLRAIVSRPEGPGPFPAVYYLQGFGCSSVDYWANPQNPLRRLVDDFARAGFAVFRIEKPGVGDSQTEIQCAEMGYEEELNAFRAGARHLRTYPFIDGENLFYFGHSLGGISAPIVALEYPPTGIAVYGTVVKPWFEYLLDIYRKQNAVHTDYQVVDSLTRLATPILYQYLIENKHPRLLKDLPAFQRVLLYQEEGERVLGMHYTYNQEINQQKLYEAWKRLDVYTLAMFGEADLQAIDAEGAQTIVDIVNHYHPGKGEYAFFPQTDHGLVLSGSQAAYWEMQQKGTYPQFSATHYNPEVGKRIVNWMREIINEQ